MCGRVVSARPPHELAAFFRAENCVTEPPTRRYNVAPTDEVYAVAASAAGRRLGTMHWGLVPSWSPDPGAGPRPINARAESILRRPLFADALSRRRCLVVVDGFYEWRREPGGSKQPYFISPADGTPLALAGLWERWRGGHAQRQAPSNPDESGPGQGLVTCAVVTVAANDTVRPLHDRMPAILGPSQWDDWLANGDATDPYRLAALLAPAPAALLTVRPASRRVNSVANDSADLLSA